MRALLCATCAALLLWSRLAGAATSSPGKEDAKSAAKSARAVPSEVIAVEGIREYRLANGLQVLLIPDASKPTITVNVTYHVGSRMESYGETGMAHLLEHLMFKSTRHMQTVAAELSKRGMRFNGSTNNDRTNYFETFPADPAQLKWALITEAERMTGANILRRDLDSEMTVVRNEMEQGENDPVNILLEKTAAAAYQWHNYGKSTIGARSDIENVNIPHLQAFYRKYYEPDDATLIVAGAFDAPAALREIALDFGKIPRPSRKLDPTYTLEPVQDGEREVTLRRAGGQAALILAYHVPAATSPDYPAFEVIANALGDTPNGRLHKRLVESGKAVQAGAYTQRQAEPGLLNLIMVLKKDDSLDGAVTTMLATAEGMAAEPVTEAELRRAQLQAAKSFDDTMADPERLCVTLSEAIADGDWRLLFVQRDRLQSLTLDHVNQVARDWMKSTNRTMGRFIPTDNLDRAPLANKISAQEALQGFHPAAAVSAGEVFDPSPANLDVRSHRFTLPSGLKAALLPKKNRGETVKLQINLHFGSAKDLDGLRLAGNFVPQLVALGSQHKTRAQIQDGFDALKTEWSVTGSAWVASARLSTTRANLIPALTLLAEVLREPAFPPGEFEQLVRGQISEAESASTDPIPIAETKLKRTVGVYPVSDVRYAPDFPEQIQDLKVLDRAAAVRLYQRFWGANHAELAIVGDFDEPATKSAVTRLFGDWVSTSAYERLSLPASTVFGQRLTSVTKDKANSFVIGELPLKLVDTDNDYPALLAAAHILGAGGFDSRLMVRLRGKEGLSYGAGANLRASNFEPSGSMVFYAIFAPQNRLRVQQGFDEEIARFVKQGVTNEELASAKKAMQADDHTRRASDVEVAAAWTVMLENARTFAFEQDLESKVQALNVEQVNQAIGKWLDPDKIDWSSAGDFK